MSKEQPKELKITILKNTFCNGKPMELGKTVSLKTDDAKALIAAGKARAINNITEDDKQAIKLEQNRLKSKEQRKSELPLGTLASTGKKGSTSPNKDDK